MKAFIIYCSPAGSTGNIARALESSLKNHPGLLEMVKLYDLGKLHYFNERKLIVPILQEIEESMPNTFIALGSPVYVGHPLPQISSFIDALPEGRGAWVFPFVSWGSVSSGVALSDLGQAAQKKGYRVAGACSLPAPHSQMWREPKPLGEGLPSRNDMVCFDQGIAKVCSRISTDREPEDVSLLDHPDQDVRDSFSKIDLQKAAGQMTHRKVEIEGKQRCTRCGQCAELCPVSAISFDPYPVFGNQCVFCFNCVRLCPTTSITADLSSKMGWLRQESERRNEEKSIRFVV